jgi:hypothetical protein
MKTTKVSTGGINEIKYPVRNNHESPDDFNINEIIRRGKASKTT